MRFLFGFIFVLIFTSSFLSCKKDNVVLDKTSQLSFYADSVLFDTVFTTIGSTTKQLKIYNKSSKKVIISSIKLGGGSNSNFKININGIPSSNISNLAINGKDSLFLFVKVTVNPNNQNNPLVIKDSIQLLTNNHLQSIKLIAWGQDAYYHTPKPNLYFKTSQGVIYYSIIDCSKPWLNDKPHVIYGLAVVDSATTLQIQPGTRIYLHNNATLWVYNGGSIQAIGNKSNPITFQGDRLESYYKYSPGQWGKIWISAGSYNNEIDYAVIKNGSIGIQVDTCINSNPTLKLNNTIIENMSIAGLYAQGATIQSTNCVLANCGQYCAYLNIGGSYDFTNCTFANYWSYSNRNTSLLTINNYYKDINSNINVRPLQKANFTNCIIFGLLQNEITLDNKYGGVFNYYFDHSLLKIDPSINIGNTTFYESVFANIDPSFNDYSKNDYSLLNGSYAIGKGKITSVVSDILDNTRKSPPDLGAYEYIP